jgi:gluconate 5-dehydrogenase
MEIFARAGRTSLITGASRGLGFATARALASAGARVVLNGRDAGALAVSAATLRAQGYEIETAAFDVTDAQAAKAGVEAIEQDVGPIDILVNNAGIQRRGALETFKDEDWRALMSTNVDSVYYMSKAVAQGMIARGRGKIINIGSVQCELARPGIAPYTATKGAVRNLTRGMCADWAPLGLQINAIAPGYFDTPLNKALVEDPEFSAWICKRTPAGRWGQMEDLAGIAIFLASSASDFVNGQVIHVDGGIVSVI